jgi:hypothetical protein
MLQEGSIDKVWLDEIGIKKHVVSWGFMMYEHGVAQVTTAKWGSVGSERFHCSMQRYWVGHGSTLLVKVEYNKTGNYRM